MSAEFRQSLGWGTMPLLAGVVVMIIVLASQSSTPWSARELAAKAAADAAEAAADVAEVAADIVEVDADIAEVANDIAEVNMELAKEAADLAEADAAERELAKANVEDPDSEG